MNIPKLCDVETAVAIYYENVDLRNPEILKLFPGIGSARIQQLKVLAREKADENGHMQINSVSVRTEDAFEAWGIDIANLERRLQKLRKLKAETQKGS